MELVLIALFILFIWLLLGFSTAIVYRYYIDKHTSPLKDWLGITLLGPIGACYAIGEIIQKSDIMNKHF